MNTNINDAAEKLAAQTLTMYYPDSDEYKERVELIKEIITSDAARDYWYEIFKQQQPDSVKQFYVDTLLKRIKDSAGVWVKASERLPGLLNTTIIGRRISDKYGDRAFTIEVKYTQIWIGMYSRWYEKQCCPEDFEWLDESQPTQPFETFMQDSEKENIELHDKIHNVDIEAMAEKDYPIGSKIFDTEFKNETYIKEEHKWRNQQQPNITLFTNEIKIGDNKRFRLYIKGPNDYKSIK